MNNVTREDFEPGRPLTRREWMELFAIVFFWVCVSIAFWGIVVFAVNWANIHIGGG